MSELMNINMQRKIARIVALFCIGGVCYQTLEIIWRGYTFYCMSILGGFLFVIVGSLNNYFSFDMPIPIQCILGAIIVTYSEFVSGLILNVWLKLNIWDYSSLPFNVLGQVCLPYALLWIPCSFLAIILDDYIRYLLFNEERPHYVWF